MKLKDKLLRLVSKKSVERTIDGEKFSFHPVTLTMLSEMGEVFAPVVQAIRQLTAEEKPRAVTTEEVTAPDGTKTKVIHAAELSEGMVQLIAKQETAAVNSAIKCLLGPESRDMLVKVLGSSMKLDEDEVREALDAMDLGTLGVFLGGFLEANAKVFGPFVEQVKAWFKSRTLRLVPKSEDAETDEAASQGSLNGSPKPSES